MDVRLCTKHNQREKEKNHNKTIHEQHIRFHARIQK